MLQRLLRAPQLGLEVYCHCRAFSAKVYLQNAAGAAPKFYTLEQGEGAAESTVTASYGRLGSAGQSSSSTHASPAAALAFLRKTEAAKRKKGYTDSTSPGGSAGGAPASTPAATAAAAAAAPTFPRVLAVGESVHVTSAAGSGATYRVKCLSAAPDGAPTALSCTCKGYAQRLHAKGALASSCRHIALVQGAAAEAARLAAAAAAPPPPPPPPPNPGVAPLSALAHSWTPRVDPTGMLLSEKLDGMRALWHEGRLWSRQGNALHAPPYFTAALPRSTTLDGELHCGRGGFSATVSVTRAQTDVEEKWRGVRFAVFDAPLVPGGFAARLAAAEAALAQGRREAAAEGGDGGGGAAVESFASILPHKACEGPEDLAVQLQAMVQAGGEGLMLRNPGGVFGAFSAPAPAPPPPPSSRSPFFTPHARAHACTQNAQLVGARMTCSR